VGKTCPVEIEVIKIEKHPHGRGEDVLPIIRGMREAETPPRAWGRRSHYQCCPLKIRNTPTGVGKTWADYGLDLLEEKHPHGRGEDYRPGRCQEYGQETPPRAWGRLPLLRR
jgi:hypothetical protein